MKARRAVVVVSAAQHSRVHRCWHLLIQTLHCGWRVLHCGRRVLHCGRRRSIEIGMLVHKDLHCWSVLRIFTNQGKVSSNIFVNIKIFLRNLRKYLIIYPLDKNPWIGPLWTDSSNIRDQWSLSFNLPVQYEYEFIHTDSKDRRSNTFVLFSNKCRKFSWHPSESQHGLATGNEKLIFVPVCIVRVGVSDELGWRI